MRDMPARNGTYVVSERKVRGPGGTATVTVRRPYNVRDQLGHWVAPKDRRGRPCPHACCRHQRVHPDNLPTTLDRDYLRSLTPRELGEELAQYVNYADSHKRGLEQITAEVDRRGDADSDALDEGYRSKADDYERARERAAEGKERARDRQRRREDEWRDEVYRQWLQAEAATNGYMLNKAGRRAGINERSLFTGPESRVAKYASPELIEFFESHPRPTRASFLGSTRERREHLAGRRIG